MSDRERRHFPDGFVWGVATSAAQIEGSPSAGGRGESIWDRYAATPGMIEDGSDARTACDHYRRWRDDIALMRELGVGGYRFSIAWPRVLPRGRGPASAAGLGFYDALIDGLLEAGLQPFVTLNHWDLPQALEEAGGWPARDIAEAFVDYADVVTRRLGDRVNRWITHNEPWCVATLGYEQGRHAPGRRDPAAGLAAAHHLLLSHGWAVEVMRRNSPGASIGIVLNLTPAMPHTDRPADLDAARWFDGFFNRWYLDPLYHERYPDDAVADRVRRGHLPPDGHLPFVRPGDMETIATPTGFLGVNYYSRVVMRAGPDGQPVAVPMAPPGQLTDMGWEVYPAGLRDLLGRLRRDYRPGSIYITENGAAFPDESGDGAGPIADHRRVAYLRDHLSAAHDALADGVPLAGYFVWSLFDNFEWAHGYTRRFGLYRVDFDTQQRLPRESALWYRRVVTSNTLDDRTPSITSRRFP